MSVPPLIMDISSVDALEVPKEGFLLLYFWADWCRPCVELNKVVEELSRKHGAAVRFARVEAEKQPQISEKWAVAVVPTFVAVVNGREVARIEGARIPELVQCVAKYAVALPATPAAGGGAASATTTAEELRARVIKLVNYAPVMLFMKGTPSEPRCGFSRQAVELLTGVGVKFCSFNILDHPDVRNALKEYSNWPTYPQLYASGKLIGGLDVMKELQAEGELVTSLPKEAFSEEAADTGVKALKKLTSRSPVMLFMKGSPQAPQCGFSNAMVQLLATQGIEYDSFDVFRDSHVREALKEYASWPTYPMLFVDGKLLGGLDIIQELVSEGQFMSHIPASAIKK